MKKCVLLTPLKMPLSPQNLTPSPFLTPHSPLSGEGDGGNISTGLCPTPKRKHSEIRQILNNSSKHEVKFITKMTRDPASQNGPGMDIAKAPIKRSRKKRRSNGSMSSPELCDTVDTHDSIMEINNHFSQLPRKDIPQASQLLSRPVHAMPDVMNDRELQAQLLSLKQQHQLQQQMLLQQFHEQQLRLAQEQDKQMANHIQVTSLLQRQQEFLEQQKALEEQQRLEKEQAEQQLLEQIKNKKKDEESAVASTEVKMKLQEFVLNKKQREATGKMGGSPPQFRQWATQHRSLEQHSPPQSGLSPPYRPPHLLGQYDSDFPLRKTVSDSNLKVRSKLKEKVVQRSSPLLRRKDLHPKRKTPLQIDTTLSTSNPDSGPNSPPTNTLPVRSEATGAAVKEEGNGPFPLQMMSKMVINQSMPNISIGPVRDSANQANSSGSPAEQAHREAELQARVAHYSLPITPHMLHQSTHPYCPSLPAIDSEFTPPTSPAYINNQMKVLEQGRGGKIPPNQSATNALASVPYTVPNSMNMKQYDSACPITDAQVAQARINRRPLAPLARTQSAPLPLGHPLLLAHQEQLLKETQKMYLKQRLQNTVLQRVGSKNHMENVDEEAEARLAQEMKEVREREEEDVVVISDREDSCPPTSHESSPEGVPDGKAFLIRQREAMILRQRTISGGSPPAPCGVHPHRPLARAQSSPAVAVPLSPPQHVKAETVKHTFTTGVAYDTLMLKHTCICGNNANHPEHAGRLQSIWARLHETGLIHKCEKIKSRKATLEELQSCHSEAYTLLYGTSSTNRQKLDPALLETLPSRFCLLPCGGVGVDADTVWNDMYSAQASRMAAGCVTELAFKVALGELKNGMAIVRPPGHHAEPNQAMGFCYFNSIAIAAKQLLEHAKLERILILDWDAHHGNSTQQIFYDNPNVLYISLHRHDSGNFFPGTGSFEECGIDKGVGFNLNVPWAGALNPPMGDAEYLAAFRTIVMPVAREFNPEIVLVSSGFDAAAGHPAPLGGYQLSSQLFGYMTSQMMTLASGKVVLVLEGGYDLPSICDASESCMQALLGEELTPLKEEEFCRRPCQVAVETMETVIKCQGNHWPCVQRYAHSVGCSLVEAQQREREEADTVSAFASLSVVREGKNSDSVSVADSTSGDTSEPMEES